MSNAATHEQELRQIVERVRDWPLEERVALASEILACDSTARLRKRTPLRNLVGIIKTEGPPPDDEEVRRMLDERRMQKYGA